MLYKMSGLKPLSLGIGTFMKRSLLAFAAMTLATTINIQAQYTYTTFSVPGSSTTYFDGISGNEILGNYTDNSGSYNFLYDGSSLTILNIPGEPLGIAGNDIVGATDTSSGFLYDGSNYTTFAVPGALYSFGA